MVHGRIDVLGIRDTGGDLSGSAELISVEVKAGRQPFTRAAGQAYGYSVYAERCYLADVRRGRPPFRDEEIAIASRLGIGLLAVGAGNRIQEVLSSPVHEPIQAMRLQAIEKLGYSEC